LVENNECIANNFLLILQDDLKKKKEKRHFWVAIRSSFLLFFWLLRKRRERNYCWGLGCFTGGSGIFMAPASLKGVACPRMATPE
jgi:hypothetical protein